MYTYLVTEVNLYLLHPNMIELFTWTKMILKQSGIITNIEESIDTSLYYDTAYHIIESYWELKDNASEFIDAPSLKRPVPCYLPSAH